MFKTLLFSILTFLMGTATMAQSVEDIMQADRDFSAMAQDGEVRDAFLAYMADGAVLLQPEVDIIDGPDAARATVSAWPDDINLSWEPVGGMIAQSGDLGFTYGRYVSRGVTAEGVEVASHGKYVSIWQRQDDGSWKWVLDGGNPSPAPEE